MSVYFQHSPSLFLIESTGPFCLLRFSRLKLLNMKIIPNKAIKKISRKSTWYGNFSRLAALRVIFSKKNKKNTFLDKVYGNMCTKFQVCIVFSLARRRDKNEYINTYTHIQVKLGISSIGRSSHVDFFLLTNYFVIVHA